MENLYQKPVRKYRGKNINNRPLEERAITVFNEVFKTLKEDLSNATPAERLNAAVQLASLFLTPKPKQEN